MAATPYLTFAGNAREAFTAYQEIFGGQVDILGFDQVPAGEDAGETPATPPDAVMHAALMAGDLLLMGADDPSGGFDGTVRGMCVACALPEVDDAHRVFAALADGGEVQMPIGPSFFAEAFGMCVDRFGTPWMVMSGSESAGSVAAD